MNDSFAERDESRCKRKRRYTTKSIAEDVRKSIPKNKTLTIYQCAVCGFWHLGNITAEAKTRHRKSRRYQAKGGAQ